MISWNFSQVICIGTFGIITMCTNWLVLTVRFTYISWQPWQHTLFFLFQITAYVVTGLGRKLHDPIKPSHWIFIYSCVHKRNSFFFLCSWGNEDTEKWIFCEMSHKKQKQTHENRLFLLCISCAASYQLPHISLLAENMGNPWVNTCKAVLCLFVSKIMKHCTI